MNTYRYLITDLKSEGLVLVLKSVEMMMRVLPSESLKFLRPLLPQLVRTVACDNPYPMMLSMYLSIVARLVLFDEEAFTWAVAKVCKMFHIKDKLNTMELETPSTLLNLFFLLIFHLLCFYIYCISCTVQCFVTE